MYEYRTKGTCSEKILFDVDDTGVIKSVQFIGGCRGNLQAVAKLSVGRKVDEIIPLLKGIPCHGGTSCPDQFAKALLEYKAKTAK